MFSSKLQFIDLSKQRGKSAIGQFLLASLIRCERMTSVCFVIGLSWLGICKQRFKLKTEKCEPFRDRKIWNFEQSVKTLFNESFSLLGWLSRVTMATSSLGGTRDFLKLSFHMFPYNEILNVFKSKLWVDIWRKHFKIPLNTKVQGNQSGGLGVTNIWNLGLCID